MRETSNSDFSDSNRWILKFLTDSDPESEELSNDIKNDCVGTKDPSLKLKKRSFSIEVYGKSQPNDACAVQTKQMKTLQNLEKKSSLKKNDSVGTKDLSLKLKKRSFFIEV